jgi:hypothetical protein
MQCQWPESVRPLRFCLKVDIYCGVRGVCWEIEVGLSLWVVMMR